MKRLGTMTIYKDKSGDCSNGGISSRFDEVVICTEVDGEAPENGVVIEKDVVFGKTRIRAVPATNTKKRWPMFGGCFIYTCNGVVPHSGKPIPLHDRFEDD